MGVPHGETAPPGDTVPAGDAVPPVKGLPEPRPRGGGRGRPLAAALTAGLVALGLACAGCAGPPPAPGRPSGTAVTTDSGSRPASPAASSATARQPPVRSCADRVFARMSQAQRVGQLFIVGLPGDRLSQATARSITGHHFGSVMFIATSTAGVAGIRAVTRAAQRLATTRATAGVGFFVAANQEGGEIQALQGPGFSAIPSALAQGRMAPAALRRAATGWGRQLAAAGVNLNFAPVMDVVPPGTGSLNQPIGVLHREYGYYPAPVAAHGTAFLRGMMRAGVTTTAKHFPGLGRVRGNTDFSSGVVDRVTTADDPYLGTFRAAVAAGVPLVMVALARYARIDQGRLAVFSSVVMRGLLRQRLGFRGVIISDDLGAAVAVARIPPATRALRFLAAGGDLITSKYPGPAAVMARAVLARSAADPAFRRTAGAAVRQVLAAKQAAGLLPCR